MFMSKDELSDDEEMGGGDVVVPLSLVASTPQVINASRPGAGPIGAGDDAPGGRSAQYNERLRRARALNEQKRKVSSGGAPDDPHSRGGAQRRAHPLDRAAAEASLLEAHASASRAARRPPGSGSVRTLPRARAPHARLCAQAAW